MVSKNANSRERPCLSSVRMILRRNKGDCARRIRAVQAGIEPMQAGA
jgi:hypothetical protein